MGLAARPGRKRPGRPRRLAGHRGSPASDRNRRLAAPVGGGRDGGFPVMGDPCPASFRRSRIEVLTAQPGGSLFWLPFPPAGLGAPARGARKRAAARRSRNPAITTTSRSRSRALSPARGVQGGADDGLSEDWRWGAPEVGVWGNLASGAIPTHIKASTSFCRPHCRVFD